VALPTPWLLSLVPFAAALRETLLREEVPEPIGWATLEPELLELRASELLWEVPLPTCAELRAVEEELLWVVAVELLWEDPLPT
jgi:hypothetical protein